MVFVATGERFHPVFPLASTKYAPVWFPEFRSDQCFQKKEEEGSTFSNKLKSIQNCESVETI